MARLAVSCDVTCPLPRAVVSYASMTFPSHRQSAFEWAMSLASKAVVARLALSSRRTLRFDGELHFPLPGLTDELEGVRMDMASDPCQVADGGRFYGIIFRKMIRRMVCPLGCDCA